MSKVFKSLLTLAALTLAVSGGLEAQQATGESVTITAQVIDLSCKVAHDLSGAEHRMCSQVCSDRGVPLALLGSDGQIYVPVSEAMPGSSENAQLREYAEETVTVTGRVVQRGGLNGFVIESVRRG
jgi:hypothetical protein